DPAGGRLRREKVAAGSLEEVQHRLVFERGRIGEVDYHLRARHGLSEALAGDCVDAGIGRSGDNLVAALAQDGDGLRANAAGAADDDDFHGLPSLSTIGDPPTGTHTREDNASEQAKRVSRRAQRKVLFPSLPFGYRRYRITRRVASSTSVPTD